MEAILQGVLTSPIAPVSPEEEEVQVLEFALGREQFALDLFDVREVVEYTPITPLPRMDSSILGIIDLRGRSRRSSISQRHSP
ncbi:CheW protein [Methanosphaerula palustris E1-9c]|uniref:CheW protein n=1 Tax=Methanosphaerula palustris (strain ATCC BAA-1556 / DSM 19958 / E1-9c) TaxID=521011 RepID=B8GE58_METPE|nr:chemotaxis protein CheW [Methanosphaerula palustris]ACL17559.1 CheW protein [Methanosphaerula palustris E1-9c]